MSTTPSTSTTFTVYFTGQFWVGVLEHHDRGWVRAARVTFGPEPSDAELYEWMLRHAAALSERAERAPRVRRGRDSSVGALSPKRAIRLAAKEAARPQASTAAQAAVAAEREARAAAGAASRRSDRKDDVERRRQLKRAKQKERHRGH